MGTRVRVAVGREMKERVTEWRMAERRYSGLRG
jgi:hypothetical protein